MRKKQRKFLCITSYNFQINYTLIKYVSCVCMHINLFILFFNAQWIFRVYGLFAKSCTRPVSRILGKNWTKNQQMNFDDSFVIWVMSIGSKTQDPAVQQILNYSETDYTACELPYLLLYLTLPTSISIFNRSGCEKWNS